MARRKNPVFDPIRREVEAAVGGSMIIVDKWFDLHQEAKADLEDALDLQAEIYDRIVQMRAQGLKVPDGDKEDLKAAIEEGNRLKKTIKALDGKIAKYYKAALKDIGARFDAFKATPGSSVYANEYNDAKRKFTLAAKQAQFTGVDIRTKIAELQGAITVLEDALGYVKPSRLKEQVRATKRRMAPPRKKKPSAEEQWRKYVEIWEAIHPRAIKTQRYKKGAEKIRFAETVKGRKLLPTQTLEVKFKQAVDEADVLMRVVSRKKARGEDVSKNLRRLKKMIDDIEVVMRERPMRLTAAQANRMLSALRKDLIPYLPTERKKRAGIAVQRAKLIEVADFRKRLNDIKSAIQGQTEEWDTEDRRLVRENIRELESAITVISPTKGAPAKYRIPASAISKRNPKKKAKKKAVKKKATKKKAGKKRKGPPPLPASARKRVTKRRSNPSTKTKYRNQTIEIIDLTDTVIGPGEAWMYEISGPAIKKAMQTDDTWAYPIRPDATEQDGYHSKRDALEDARSAIDMAFNIIQYGSVWEYDAAQREERGPPLEPERKVPEGLFHSGIMEFKNPKKKAKKKAAKKKATKKRVSKRKTKKKTSRAVTPEWQRLIRRCQKLWDHYCERPGKKRLQDVLKHIEKMKDSTSKKVLDERKKCLRAAKAEAKRLKLK